MNDKFARVHVLLGAIFLRSTIDLSRVALEKCPDLSSTVDVTAANLAAADYLAQRGTKPVVASTRDRAQRHVREWQRAVAKTRGVAAPVGLNGFARFIAAVDRPKGLDPTRYG